MSAEIARDYFEFIADLGMTKHYGSMEATRELVEMCRIGSIYHWRARAGLSAMVVGR